MRHPQSVLLSNLACSTIGFQKRNKRENNELFGLEMIFLTEGWLAHPTAIGEHSITVGVER
jgi:hypothetical protein